MTTSLHYHGFAHCHSTFSYDGKCSYAELKNIFIGHGLQFVCITEHIEQLNQANIDAIIAGCRDHSDETFLFIPGIEMDEFVVYFIGINDVKIDFSTSKSVFDSLKESAQLCIFSHPIKANYLYPQWLMEISDGVEVWNSKHDGSYFPRFQSLQLLKKLQKLKPNAVSLAGMDFHKPSNLSAVSIQLINAGPLTECFVLNEIKLGNFVICKDKKPISTFPTVQIYFFWFRIAMMDLAHAFHLALTKQGISVPKPIKRFFRILMEGK